MPYITDKMKLESPFLDRRVKLLPCQKERMKLLWEQGTSQRELAKMFNVSRRLVQFTCMPEKLEECKQKREERGGWRQYYKGGEEWAETQRDHRKYKYKTLKK
jgi:transposase